MTSMVNETTADIRRTARRQVRTRSAFEVWAWAPVIVLRIALVIVYAAYVYAAIIAFLVGIPIFNLLNFGAGYTSVWAVLLGLSSLVAWVGALSERWEQIEKWAAMVMTCLLLAYVGGLNLQAYGAGDLNRMFIGVVAFIAAVLPAIRFVYLAAQTGKKRATTEGDLHDSATGS